MSNLRRNLVAGGLVLASGLAALVLNSELAKRKFETEMEQSQQAALNQAIKFNPVTLEEKSRIISQLYDGRAKLIPITYSGNQQYQKESYKIGQGLVQIESSGGDIHATYLKKETKLWCPPERVSSGFILSGRANFALLDQNVNILERLTTNSGLLANETYLSTPHGNSLVIVNAYSQKGRIKELVDGLKRFADKNPGLDLSDAKITVIRDALDSMDYIRPEEKCEPPQPSHVFLPTLLNTK